METVGRGPQAALPVGIVNAALADALSPTAPPTGSEAQAVLGTHLLVRDRVSCMPTGHVSSGGSCSGGLKPWSPPVAWHAGQEETPHKCLSSLPEPGGPTFGPPFPLTLPFPRRWESGADGWAEPIHGLSVIP